MNGLPMRNAPVNEPLVSLSTFCNAMRTWFRCIQQGIERAEAEGRIGHGADYADMLLRIETDISKSSLLARLLYDGEELRTRECPEHKGRWSGIGPCRHGCGMTGWIPNEWPDGAQRCSRHHDRPAVVHWCTVDGGAFECYECFRARHGDT